MAEPAPRREISVFRDFQGSSGYHKLLDELVLSDRPGGRRREAAVPSLPWPEDDYYWLRGTRQRLMKAISKQYDDLSVVDVWCTPKKLQKKGVFEEHQSFFSPEEAIQKGIKFTNLPAAGFVLATKDKSLYRFQQHEPEGWGVYVSNPKMGRHEHFMGLTDVDPDTVLRLDGGQTQLHFISGPRVKDQKGDLSISPQAAMFIKLR